jgi:hypothetical protein
MGASCAPLLADLFLYSHEADLIQELLKKNEKKLARSFNFTGLNCKTFFYYIVKIILYKKYIFTGIREINNDLPIDGFFPLNNEMRN